MKIPARTWAAIGIVVVLLLGGLLWWLSSNDSDAEPTPKATASAPANPTNSPTPAASTEPPRDLKAEPALTKEADFGQGSRAKVTSIEAVASQGTMPGEISAPAIRVTVEVKAGKKDINLAGVVINAYYGKDLTPADLVGKPGGKPFEGTLKSRKKAVGVYVFNVPTAERDDVSIEFIHPGNTKPLILQGSVS